MPDFSAKTVCLQGIVEMCPPGVGPAVVYYYFLLGDPMMYMPMPGAQLVQAQYLWLPDRKAMLLKALPGLPHFSLLSVELLHLKVGTSTPIQHLVVGVLRLPVVPS